MLWAVFIVYLYVLAPPSVSSSGRLLRLNQVPRRLPLTTFSPWSLQRRRKFLCWRYVRTLVSPSLSPFTISPSLSPLHDLSLSLPLPDLSHSLPLHNLSLSLCSKWRHEGTWRTGWVWWRTLWSCHCANSPNSLWPTLTPNHGTSGPHNTPVRSAHHRSRVKKFSHYTLPWKEFSHTCVCIYIILYIYNYIYMYIESVWNIHLFSRSDLR